jgi:lysozyme
MRQRVAAGLLALSAAGLVAIATHEGYRDAAYVPVPGDRPTLGFGQANDVRPGERTDPVRALIRLGQDVSDTERGLRACIGDVPLYQHEWDSYVSWAINVGVGAACGSTLVRRLQARDYEAACRELLRWDHFRGEPLRGLTLRRRAEYRQCMGQ